MMLRDTTKGYNISCVPITDAIKNNENKVKIML